MSAGGARLLLHLLTAAYGPSRHIALPHELGRYRRQSGHCVRRITPQGLWVHGLL
jgi:hypothetical protein